MGGDSGRGRNTHGQGACWGQGRRGERIRRQEERRCSKGVRDWKDSGTISTMERKKQAGRNAWRQVKTAD